MIEFEERTDRQKGMVTAINNFSARIQDKYKDKIAEAIKEKELPTDILADIISQAMSGEPGKYLDMFFATVKTGLPVKLDTIRLLMMYGKALGGPEDMGLPKLLSTFNLVKYAVTAMGLAAISSGPGGMKLIQKKYLPQLMKGKAFCYCITEPDAGTNTNKISTTAVFDGENYKLTGQKTFISAADSAQYMVVIAKVICEGEPDRIGTFIMDAKSEGISMTPLDIACLGDLQFTVYFDNVTVPIDGLVGKKASTGKGISTSVFYTLNLERIMVAFIMIRVCQAALDKALERAKQVDKHGFAMGSLQSVKQKLAKTKLKLEFSNLAAQRATVEYDKKGVPSLVGMYANMAKLVSTDAACEACEAALSIYGVEGLDKESDIGPLYQIARVLKVAPINNEMVLNFLGENLLGLPKSYK